MSGEYIGSGDVCGLKSNKERVPKIRLVVPELGDSVGVIDPPVGCMQDGMGGCSISFHGGAQPGIDVCLLIYHGHEL